MQHEILPARGFHAESITSQGQGIFFQLMVTTNSVCTESRFTLEWMHILGLLALQYPAPEFCLIFIFRYITWIHVGISTRTAVAVLRLYLDMVEECGLLFDHIRSDRGTETPMMANANWQLHQGLIPDVRFETV